MTRPAPGHPRALALTIALGLSCIGVLGACSGPKAPTAALHGDDISGVMPSLEFTLTGPSGATMTAADLRGKTVLLYFGYTHCPDVCPTTLAVLAQALKRLGPAAAAVRVLFVSVDPKRDSGQALARYASYFGPQFIGLTGTDNQLTALTKRYRVAYRRDPPDARGDYAVYHSSAVFVFDQDGRARLLATPSETSDELRGDLNTVIRSGNSGPPPGVSAAATAENVLNVYNWSDFIGPSIISDFEKESGIKVHYDVYDSNEMMEVKLLSGHTNYDIVVPGGSFLEREVKAGVYRKLDKSLLPNLKNLDPGAALATAVYDPGNQYGVDYTWLISVGMGYELGKVKARLPDAPFDSWPPPKRCSVGYVPTFATSIPFGTCPTSPMETSASR
jgi:protein SCO1/2